VERMMRRKKMALFLRGTAWFSSRPILAAVTRSPAIKALAAAIGPNKSEATELQKHTEHAPGCSWPLSVRRFKARQQTFLMGVVDPPALRRLRQAWA